MARRFGKIQRLLSGNYRASFVGPDGGRHFAAATFPTEADAERWLAAQRTDILRETWKAPRRTGQSLQEYSLRWVGQRTDLKPRKTALYVSLLDLQRYTSVIRRGGTRRGRRTSGGRPAPLSLRRA